MNDLRMPTQFKLRKRLLDNGYIPIPTKGKQTLLPGWPSVKVTEETLRAWDAHEHMPGTGLRCDNLVVFDVDTLDRVTGHELLFTMARTLGDWNYMTRERMDGPITHNHFACVYHLANGEPAGSRQLSPRWADSAGETHGLDLLTGPTSQMAAYGRRSDGTRYAWEHGPREMPLASLEPVTLELATKAFEHMIEVLDVAAVARGWERVNKGRTGDAARPVPCLTGDSVFEIIDPDLGRLDLDTIEKLLRHEPENTRWACHLTALRPDSDSGAGRAFIGRDGRAVVADHTQGLLYVRGHVPGQPVQLNLFGGDPTADLRQYIHRREAKQASPVDVDAARAAVDAVLSDQEN